MKATLISMQQVIDIVRSLVLLLALCLAVTTSIPIAQTQGGSQPEKKILPRQDVL